MREKSVSPLLVKKFDFTGIQAKIIKIILLTNELKRQQNLTGKHTTMKKYFFSLLSGLLLMPILFAHTATAQDIRASGKSPVIGNLKRLHKTYGCDCKFQTLKEARTDPANKFVFQSDLGATFAWMNIDGKDVKLKLIYASPATKGVLLGSRSYKKFSAKGISILIKYVVNATCPEENPDCDATGFIATITVSNGGHRQSIKATGMCGWC